MCALCTSPVSLETLGEVMPRHADRTRRARSSMFVSAAALIGLVVLQFATVVGQSTVVAAGAYQVIARHSGKCLDVNGASTADGADVLQFSCHGGQNQKWDIEPTSDGYYRLLARHSGKALEVAGSSIADGALVQQRMVQGGANQQWSFESTGDGYYRLIARHSGKALDVSGVSMDDGAPVIQWTPHGGANQQWLLRSASRRPTLRRRPTPPAFSNRRRGDRRRRSSNTCGRSASKRFLDEQFSAPMSSYPTLHALSHDARYDDLSERTRRASATTTRCIRCRTGSS